MKYHRYDDKDFKETVKKYANIGVAVIKTKLSNESNPNMNFFIRIFEDRVVRKYIRNIGGINITYDLDLIGILLYHMYVKKLNFDDAYTYVFGSDEHIYYYTFMCNNEINTEHCNICDSGNIKCSECDGSGEVECSECVGTGEVDGEDCDVCNGDVYVYCDECRGERYTSCEECDGGVDYISASFNFETYVSDDVNFAGLSNNIETLEELEVMCEKNNISHSYYRTYTVSYDFRDETDTDNVRNLIRNVDLVPEKCDEESQILVSNGYGLPDISDAENIIQRLF